MKVSPRVTGAADSRVRIGPGRAVPAVNVVQKYIYGAVDSGATRLDSGARLDARRSSAARSSLSTLSWRFSRPRASARNHCVQQLRLCDC